MEVARLIARYVADTRAFDAGSARVNSQLTATEARTKGAMARGTRETRGMGMVGLAVVAGTAIAVGKSIMAYANYNRTLNVFRVTTQATTKEMKEASAAAVKLGADTRFPGVTAADAADAMVELGKAGFTARQSLDSVEGTLLLGVAGQMDYADASGITAKAINAFNLKAKDSIRITDMLAGAAISSSTDVRGIGDAFQYSAAAAAIVGLPIDQLITSLGLLAQGGLSSSMMGTSMRMFLTSLTGRSAKAIGVMTELGIVQHGLVTSSNKMGSAFFTAEGKMKSMAAIADIWRASTAKLSNAEKLRASNTIFGIRGMNVAKFVLDATAKNTDKVTKAVHKQGQGARLASAQTQGLMGALQKLLNVGQTISLLFGQALAPYIIVVANALTFLLTPLTENQWAMKILAFLVGALTVSFIAWRLSMFMARIALRQALADFIAFNMVLLTSPIFWIGLAILAIVLILRHFGVSLNDLARIATGAWDALKSVFVTGFAWFKKNWLALALWITVPLLMMDVLIVRHWGQIMKFLHSLPAKVWAAVKKIMDAGWQAIKDAASYWYQGGKDLGAALAKGVWDGLKGLPRGILDSLTGGGFSKVGGAITDVGATVIGGIAAGTGGNPAASVPTGYAHEVSHSDSTLSPRSMGASVSVENMNVRSEDDLYSVASILGRKLLVNG